MTIRREIGPGQGYRAVTVLEEEEPTRIRVPRPSEGQDEPLPEQSPGAIKRLKGIFRKS